MAQTGYMPVRNGAFDAIENYDKFPEPTESYRQLYAALKIMQESYTPLSIENTVMLKEGDGPCPGFLFPN